MVRFIDILHAVREHGTVHTARAAARFFATLASRAIDSGFDNAHGLATAEVVEVADMHDVRSPNLAHGIRYEPSRARPLRRLLTTLDLPTGGVFVDIGCGRGRALILAARAGFSRVAGIEYSPSLCEAARQNLAAFPGRPSAFEVEVIETDAAQYRFTPDQTVFYLFNPFDAVVLERVLDNIDASLAAAPRAAWLIYQYPAHRGNIDARDYFNVVRHVCYGGCEFVVYRNR